MVRVVRVVLPVSSIVNRQFFLGSLMRAIRVHEHGGPDVLKVENVDRPVARAGEAIVQVSVAGLNFIDVYYRTGLNKPPRLPFTLGMEAAGVVVEIAPDVTGVRVGDRVGYSMELGAFAECAAVPAWKLAPLPDAVSDEQAAALMLQGLTAHYLTHDTFPLKPGHVALVHAAAGGAGLLLTQVARLRGAGVIGTVGTDAKAELAREAGASEVIVYSRDDFEVEVKKLTGGRGVDVVYDSVGAATFDRSLNCLRPRGYMVLFGNSSGPVPPFDPMTLAAKGSIFLTRPGLNRYSATRDEILGRTADLFRWLATGELTLRIDSVRPLTDVAGAQRDLEARRTAGKVLLRI
jgi:NADPH2:quinone reductase